MKAKFSTYLDLDLPGMETEELLLLIREAEDIIASRQSSEKPISSLIGDKKIIERLEGFFGKRANRIFPREVACMTKAQFLDARGISVRYLATLNKILLKQGYESLK